MRAGAHLLSGTGIPSTGNSANSNGELPHFPFACVLCVLGRVEPGANVVSEPLVAQFCSPLATRLLINASYHPRHTGVLLEDTYSSSGHLCTRTSRDQPYLCTMSLIYALRLLRLHLLSMYYALWFGAIHDCGLGFSLATSYSGVKITMLSRYLCTMNVRSPLFHYVHAWMHGV